MHRADLEHLIRAAGAITGAGELIVIGSQAVLGQFPDAPRELLVSQEADLFTLRGPEDAELIDGSIGEFSPFHKSFGYFAHGVGSETAVLPDGWKDRLVAVRAVNTGDVTGLCLEVHDLAISKLVAAREKDLDFVGVLLRHRMADAAVLRDRLRLTDVPDDLRAICAARIDRLAAA